MNHLKQNWTQLYKSIYTILISAFTLIACSDGNVSGDSQSPDPAVVDFPIAFIQRSLPMDEDDQLATADPREPFAFNAGAKLYLKERASPTASSLDISSAGFEAEALYDIKDIAVNDEGNKILFSMHAPEIEDADDDEQPTWNIWQYDYLTQTLLRIIQSDTIAEEGQDIAPQYLPDGSILFSSTRQRSSKAILIDEGKTQFVALDEDQDEPSAVLHVMDEDGTNIRQITFNQSHDLNPIVLRSGKILFSRWDHAGNSNGFDLYQVDPDGHHLHFVYGKHSHEILLNETGDNTLNETSDNTETFQFTMPSELPSGEIILLPQRYNSESIGTDLLLIDTNNFTETNQPIGSAAASLISTQTSLAFGDVNLGDGPSVGGRFSHVFPLWDGSDRLLISWSDCRLIIAETDEVGIEDDTDDPALEPELIQFCSEENLADATLQEADPLFGLWMYDPNTQTQLPLELPPEGQAITEAVALAPMPAATFLGDNVVDSSLADQNLGILHIRSVYDFDGVDLSPAGISVTADPLQTSVSQRPARFVRILKAVSQADRDLVEVSGSAFGVAGRQFMKEILGYADVEPDGSVRVTVPANVAFTLSVLDVEGKRLNSSERHQNWLQVRPGEALECQGCHTQDSELPHGRPDANVDSINLGASTTGLPFPNTNPSLLSEMGESMAQTRSRVNGTPALNVNLKFNDLWNNPDLGTAADAFELTYTDLTTPVPVATSCVNTWTSLCRIVIHYPTHIHPLWEADREISNELGALETTTCQACHSPVDADGETQVPAGQLDLAAGQSLDNDEQIISFRELFFSDNEQIVVDGVLTDRLEQDSDANGNLLFQTNGEGELILDENNDPIPVLIPINVNSIMSGSGATNNVDFFALFANGASHDNYLSDTELKLLIEWLDIGGQYYNDPFAVPQD